MERMNLNYLRDRAYKTASKNGFHDKELSNSHYIMLVITELSEAVEADRKGMRAKRREFLSWQALDIGDTRKDKLQFFKEDFQSNIKDTIEDELADAVIRILDLCGFREIDAYTVPMEPIPSYHTFTEHMFHVCRILTDRFFDSSPETLTFQLSQAMSYILSYSERHDIDLLWHVEQKMKYNELRPKMHEKKY